MMREAPSREIVFLYAACSVIPLCTLKQMIYDSLQPQPYSLHGFEVSVRNSEALAASSLKGNQSIDIVACINATECLEM